MNTRKFTTTIFIGMLLSGFSLFGQSSCIDHFVESLTRHYEKQEKKIQRKASRMKIPPFDNMITIVEVFIKKKHEKLLTLYEIEPQDLFCYLRPHRIMFDEAFLLRQDSIIGRLMYSHYRRGLQVSMPRYLKSYERVFQELLLSRMVFVINNFYCGYWYVKGDQLWVLVDLFEDGTYQTLLAKDYIELFIQKRDLYFIGPRKVMM